MDHALGGVVDPPKLGQNPRAFLESKGVEHDLLMMLLPILRTPRLVVNDDQVQVDAQLCQELGQLFGSRGMAS